MKFTIIDPGFMGEYGFGKWGNAYWSTAINHGIAQISGVLKKNKIDCSLIDFRRLKSYHDFEKIIESSESEWYGISCRTIDVPILVEAVSIIKRVNPDAKVVVGGIHPSLEPEYFLSNQDIDYVFTGEADITLPKLIKNPSSFKKLVKGEVPDINESPEEDIEIYDYKQSISFSLYGGIVLPPTIPFITSRGCVYQCKFCQPAEQILYGKKYRQKKIHTVINEIELILSRYDVNSIMFYDDCLLAQKKYVFELFSELRKNKKLEIMVQGRADNICSLGDDLFELKKLGLNAVIVGFESGSQRILDFIGKKTTVEQNIMAGEILHKNGIKIVGNFMIGLPTETKEEMMQTVELAKKIKPTIASCSFYSPMRGSYIYEYCDKNDLIIERDFKNLSRDPRKPKIKGVDYNYANQALIEIVGSRFNNKILKKLVGILYKNLERGVLREVLTKAYNTVFK